MSARKLAKPDVITRKLVANSRTPLTDKPAAESRRTAWRKGSLPVTPEGAGNADWEFNVMSKKSASGDPGSPYPIYLFYHGFAARGRA